MGLDMYAYAVAKGADLENKSVDVSLEGLDDSLERIAYWRKFNHLHGWMNELYHAKGGKSPDFNLDTVEITENDLNDLEKALEDGLPHTPGFFFGGDEVYPEDIEETKAFIETARECLQSGQRVFYYAWW